MNLQNVGWYYCSRAWPGLAKGPSKQINCATHAETCEQERDEFLTALERSGNAPTD